MLLKEQKKPLVLENIPTPSFNEDEILIKVSVCGVCRTDLHVQEGDLAAPRLPLILGHEIVGIVSDMGKNVRGFHQGQRVGVPWLGKSCGHCSFCIDSQENLCDNGQYTGYQLQGGFAEYAVCASAFVIPLPQGMSDAHIAPLLCAGLIGYRAYRKAAPKKRLAKHLGLYGFGASAHIVTQLAIHEGKEIYAFTKKKDSQRQKFAQSLGAVWAGDSTSEPPVPLDAAIIFAPEGALVPIALKNLKKGGRLICGGIYMSDIPSFPYKDLWGEKVIASTANVTRRDAQEFFELISQYPIRTEVTMYPLEEANRALRDLKEGKFHGAAVLQIE